MIGAHRAGPLRNMRPGAAAAVAAAVFVSLYVPDPADLSGALLGAFGLAGCASISGSDADPAVSVSADAPPPRRAPSRSADRYYHYTVAQYEARQGRIQDAISELKQTIAEDPDTVMDVYEPYLLQMGFIQRTPRGRIATARAYEHLGLPPREDVAGAAQTQLWQ